MVCKWPIAWNNTNNLLVIHAIRKPYLLTFMNVYCHCVIEWRSFQPTSILSYLWTKTKFLLSDLPASGYWSNRVSLNVLSLEHPKIPGTYPNITLCQLRWSALKVPLRVYMFWSLFSRQHRNIGICLWPLGSEFFF